MGKYTKKKLRFFGMISLSLISLLVMVSSVVGTAPQDHNSGKAKWTIMIYSDASDKDLDNDSLSEMAAMERVGSNDNVKIIIQWYRDANISNITNMTYGGQKWNGVRRYLISKGNNSSQELGNISNVDMTNMDTLAEFINWTVAKYPAEKYALVMYDHGGGWQGHTYDKSERHATLKSLGKALDSAGFSSKNKLDLIVFDMCLMGQIDVAYAMAPYAKAMVASEDNAFNVYLNESLSALVMNPKMDEKQLAASIVDGYRSANKENQPFTTLSAFDLNKMPKLTNATRNLSDVLEKHMNQNWSDIGWCVSNSEHFRTNEGMDVELSQSCIDLLDFANLIRLAINDSEVKNAIDGLNSSINNSSINSIIFKEYHGNEHSSFAHGLSIYFPMNEILYDINYSSNSSFASRTGWNDLLHDYFAAAYAARNLSNLTISIRSILPQPTNLINLANISCSINGENIIYISKFIGIENKDKITILNESEIEPRFFDARIKRHVTFNDGENYLDFPVSLVTHNLTNKEKSLYVYVYPVDEYGNGTYYLEVYGTCSNSNNYFEPFNATLTFDSKTGKLISALDSDQPEIGYFDPEAGDTFTPTNRIYDELTRTWDYDYSSANISLDNGNIWLEQSYPHNGNYSTGVYAKDLSGNEVTDSVPLIVSGRS